MYLQRRKQTARGKTRGNTVPKEHGHIAWREPVEKAVVCHVDEELRAA